MKKLLPGILCLLFSSGIAAQSDQPDLKEYRWTTIETASQPAARHENGFVEYKGKFYLIGGRGINPVNVFDPETETWETMGNPPLEMHHFQAVVYDDAIFLVGAMTGSYPSEKPLENIWLYFPESDSWKAGPEIPSGRRRGSAGTVIYDNKIYLVCGIEYGHTSGTTNYFDCFDPETGKWEELTSAPHIRDHFPAIVIGDRLYCIGGRNTSVHHENNFGAFFEATVPEVDVYDFKMGKWFTLPDKLPVPTAAGGAVSMGSLILYIGGEGKQKQAYNQTQRLDTETGKWDQLAPLNTGRHGSNAIFYNDSVYLAAGSPNKGGGNLSSIEVFAPDNGWNSIFNGRNLDGWSIGCQERDRGKEYWRVENGLLICDTKGRTDHSYIWLINDKEYSDFELRLRFQASRQNEGNSGVQVRSRWDPEALVDDMPGNKGWLDGPQVDIDPTSPWRNGFIYDETRGHRRWINPSLADWKIDSAVWAPKRFIHYFDNEDTGWNEMTIICKGTSVKTIVNNIVVSEYDGSGVLNDEYHRKYNVGIRGHVALQLHMNSCNLIRFKDIEVRELK
jgi:hypothetical protein